MAQRMNVRGEPGAMDELSPAAPLPSPSEAWPERVHLLGAGGAGVSAAALLLRERGVAITCSDRAESEHTQMLRERGIAVEIVGNASLRSGVGLVVRSAAVPDSDPCVSAARERGVTVLKYSDLLARLCPTQRTLAVAGTHGKTSTTWMLHAALRGLLDVNALERGRPTLPRAPLPGSLPRPGAVVGGIDAGLGVNAVEPGPGGWFAVEACEYDRSFLKLAPHGAAVTNVEADHLDYYGSLAAIEDAFARFVDRAHPDGLIALGPDVPERVEVAARCRAWRLGRELDVQLLDERAGRFAFRLCGPDINVERCALPVPGRFQVDNAALALALAVGLAAREWGLDPLEAGARAARGVESYRGCRRRFESWGLVDEIEVVHDYAHHPTEVRATLEAARRAFPGRPLHVLFQPHQHSRTARFLVEFAASLAAADRVVVADVYGARAHIDGVSAGAPELAQELRALGVEALAGGALAESVERFAEGLPPRCAAFVLGAGDIGGIRHELFGRLALSGARAGGARA
jgi:UDP-N-acetylmuramate--alanine ligase